MINNEQFKEAKDILWNENLGHLITTNSEISEKLGEALQNAGVNVKRIGRKPRSRNKFLFFEIEVKKVVGGEQKFLTESEAKAWHNAKNRSLNTLMKAPNEAFEEVKTEPVTEMIWWNQAFSLAYRLGADIDWVTERILKYRVVETSSKFGL